jgi:hypothetical protein
MRYLPSLVTVRDIQPQTSRAEHPPETIEQLARGILAAGGLARPLVVRQTGMESFALLEGELAYHAAARARELDPVQAEAVLAFVATRENEAELLKQHALLGARDADGPVPGPATGGEVSVVISRLEQMLTQQFRQQEEHQRRENEAFRQTNFELAKRIPRPPQVLRLLNGDNDELLTDALRRTGQKAEALLAAIRAERPFPSLQDAVKRVSGLTDGRVTKLTDHCEGHVKLRDPLVQRAGARETAMA